MHKSMSILAHTHTYCDVQTDVHHCTLLTPHKYVRTYVRYICHCNHASIATACHTPHWLPAIQHQHTIPIYCTVRTANSKRTPTLEASTVTGLKLKLKQPPFSLHPTTDSVMLDTVLASCFLEPFGASTFLAHCMCICTCLQPSH